MSDEHDRSMTPQPPGRGFPTQLRALDQLLSAQELMAALGRAGVALPSLGGVLDPAGTGGDGTPPEPWGLRELVTGRRVAITGAGGSLGMALCLLMGRGDPAGLLLIDHDENALSRLYEVMVERLLGPGHSDGHRDGHRDGRTDGLDDGHGDVRLADALLVADVRDAEAIATAFSQFRPEVVVHAAGLRHIPLLERQPGEAVKTNVHGTDHVLAAAVAADVEVFVNLSSYEAAAPTTVLGRTERAAEQLTTRTAVDHDRRFVSVRLPNVLATRGSMLTTFLSQLDAGRPLTVTGPDVTRHFITADDAARQVLAATLSGRPGEVLVVTAGTPVRILDVALDLVDALSPGAVVSFTGLRAGERAHSLPFGPDENPERVGPRILRLAGDPTDPWPTVQTLAAMPDNEHLGC